MIWLTWRQFRTQGIVAACALGALAITLAVTGLHLAALGNSSGLSTCGTHCGAQAANFINAVKGGTTELIFYGVEFLLYAVPALIGIFWGAPLVTREVEAGTYRLAWNQSITRDRWVAAKLGLLGLAAMATAGLLSLMTGWWAGPLYRASQQAGRNALSINRLAPPLFGATGIVPIGYAAFAFALGVLIGVLVRRTLPAMAITLAVFTAIQILWPGFVRPHLISPVSATQSLSTISFNGIGDYDNGRLLLQVSSLNGRADDWITSSFPVNAAGQTISKAPQACMSIHDNFLQCLASQGVKMSISYQPASRYWTFQWLEAGIFLVLALGLGWVCLWRIRRLD
jgi:ABC-type transport system involved in multi-copper enzyme maturation permease subunit